jgi:HSP20 family protein
MSNLLVRRRADPWMPMADEYFGDFWNRLGLPRPMETPALGRALMDIVDKGEAFEVKIDMPGVRKEDINVSIDAERVTINAETKEEKEVKNGGKVLHTERYMTSYARSFELPTPVSDANADAHYEDGVLTLTLPKRAPTTSQRLAIH